MLQCAKSCTCARPVGSVDNGSESTCMCDMTYCEGW